LDQVFCKGRKTPLLIGSVKSNLGHSEPASGMCSIIKVLIAMETGIIPPNLHYYNPREGVEALVEGRLMVHFRIQYFFCKQMHWISLSDHVAMSVKLVKLRVDTKFVQKLFVVKFLLCVAGGNRNLS
jgi:hypothetical protein